MRSPRGTRGLVIGIAVLLAAVSGRAQQLPCNAAPFLAAIGWKGTVTITGTGAGTIIDSFGGTYTYNVNQSIQLVPSLTTSQGGSPHSITGSENASVKVNDTYTYTDPPAPGIPTNTTTYTLTAFGDSALGDLGGGAGLDLVSIGGCGYAFGADDTFSPFTTTVNGSSSRNRGMWGPPNFTQFFLPPITSSSSQFLVPFPTSGTALNGSVTFHSPVVEGYTGPDPADVPDVVWTISWSLTPTTDLDVIVQIPAYANWRPTGGLNKIETGLDPATMNFNLLEIQAQLIHKSTGQVVDFSPDKWTFSLVQVSHQPGVTMNWPPAKQNLSVAPPDLSFDAQACARPINCISITENDKFDTSDPTNAVFVTQDPLSFASVKIALSPHDWGGWATLNVIATVGGQPILGHLQLPPPAVSDPNDTEILLPQRQAGSVIADSWKNSHNVLLSTLDDDDSEAKPNGDGQSGDGLTLYEEYRGFYMGCTGSASQPVPEGAGVCQRVEGDPAKKDLFVVDTTPTLADNGVALFKADTGLNVHYLHMTLDDVGAKDASNPGSYRVVNFNNSGSSLHVVDQHALVIVLGSQTGFSLAVNTDDFNCPNPPVPHACRPGIPKEEDRVALGAYLPSYRNSFGGYGELLIDHTIAHELSHSVDVYHHGDIDGSAVWAVDSSGNITENGTTIYVKTEDQDPSVLMTTVPVANIFAPGKSSKDVFVGNRNCSTLFTSTVEMNGQHSGDQSSIMRYPVAQAYIPAGFPKVRFWVRETLGLELTDHPQGTGVNDPNRMINGMPRVRYGDAYSGVPNQGSGSPGTQRGNDSSQIDVNDTHSAIIRPTQTVCP